MFQNYNELFSNYYDGTIKRNELEGALYTFLLNNKEKTCLSHWTADEYEDFVSWFYPRLQRCINSYKDTGASFEAFINKYIHVASREFHTRNVIHGVTETSAWSARVTEMYTHENPPTYTYNENDTETENNIEKLINTKRGRRSNKQRILALVLKCYYYVSVDFVDKIAPLIGMQPDDLMKLINQIKIKRQDKDNYIYELRERIFSQFYRCMVYSKRMTIINENTISYKKIKASLEKARKRLEKMRIRMSKIRTDATNQQIADAIGVSKGTVDSCLHKLKLQWEKLAENADLN